ncbi:MAG TPA: hypothetical protein VNV16_12865, partial [Methylibium sp.]|nr:hypothetical protein [Methylibium sp.]
GPYLPPSTHDFPGVIKGLRTLDSVRNAIDTELARAKIEASALADKVEANLKTIDAAGAPTLFPDKASLVLKAPDDLAAVIAQRIAAEQKRQDDERERIRAEEAARVEREAARGEVSTARPDPVGGQVDGCRAPESQPGVCSGHAPQDDTSLPAPPIKLGDICARLGFDLRAEFIEITLGIKRCGNDKRTVLFKASDFTRICDALVKHVRSVEAN